MTAIAYTCSFVPAEWIEAHGLSACRVVPSLGEGAACGMQTGMCPYVRAFVGRALHVDDTPMLFTTVCDQMRRAAELVRRQSGRPLFLMNVPATWQTPVAERMYASELRRLSRFLRELGGHEPREVCRRAAHDANKAAAPSSSIRLAIAGGPFADEAELRAQVEDAGAAIVLDATDTGERMRPAEMNAQRLREDSIGELVRTYLAIPSIHHRPNHRLLTWLKGEIQRRKVQGLVLRRYVWCDLWHAEARRISDEVGVPVLDLEVDSDSPAIHARTATRIGSFVEMLSASASMR